MSVSGLPIDSTTSKAVTTPASTPKVAQSSHDTQRARIRALRQRENEEVERKEEEAALVMTESQLKTLYSSFESVKTEFFDLDGLQWPASAWPRATAMILKERPPNQLPPARPQLPSLQSCPSDTPTIRAAPSEPVPRRVVTSPIVPCTPPRSPSSGADAIEDTIRAPRLRSRRPSLPQSFAAEVFSKRRHGKTKRKVSADYKRPTKSSSTVAPAPSAAASAA